jgi:hypothetical protein
MADKVHTNDNALSEKTGRAGCFMAMLEMPYPDKNRDGAF